MGIAGVSHVPIQVRDIEESLGFYRDFLGMTVSVDLEETYRGAQLHRRGVYLRWLDQPRAPFVVLGCPIDHAPVGEPTALNNVGIDHIGFFVDDIAPFIEKADAIGIRRLGPSGPPTQHAPLAYGDEGTGHVKSVFFFDPNGILVQLDQWCDEEAKTAGSHVPWSDGAISR